MDLFKHDRTITDRAAMLARYFASGMQEGLSAAMQEEVLSVLLRTASMMDFKTVVKAFTHYHCGCKHGSALFLLMKTLNMPHYHN